MALTIAAKETWKRVHQATNLYTPAVSGEHCEANGRPKDCKHQHEDDVHAHLPDVCHQIEHPAITHAPLYDQMNECAIPHTSLKVSLAMIVLHTDCCMLIYAEDRLFM